MEKKSILLVEDKEVVASVIRDVLISTGRYDVVSALDGYKALLRIIGDENYPLPSEREDLEETIGKLARRSLDSLPMSRTFDLVLSDIRMPGIDGIGTLKLIRMLCPGQPCALVTGFGMEDRQEEIDELGPKAILRKPLTNNELVSAIDGACGAATQVI